MKYAVATALLLAVAVPGIAQVPDPLAMTTDPADRAVMAEAASAVAGRPPDLAKLDAVLAKLPRPTPLRGMVQTVRAGVLASARNAGPAVAAVEEALRLLPDDPRPKLVAAGVYTFAGAPQRAADLWMEASRESPDYARTSDRYLMLALVGRLTDIGDRVRADRISARLDEIGFSAGLAPERSSAALARIREAIRNRQDADAIQTVTAIGNPNDLLSLYVDRRYAALWPRITEWAGADLAAQSLRYLNELRAGWTAADDFETATPYARQLARYQAFPTIVTLFLPMFERVQPGAAQNGAEFLAPIVARALATMDRGVEARALLAKVAASMPPEDSGNALNIDGAYLTLASMTTNWPDVLARADMFLARARTLGSNVNRSAVTSVQAWRACALWRTNQGAAAQRATAEVVLAEAILPGAAMDVHVCRGDIASARALLTARLTDEATRDWALHYVQPRLDTMSTPLARLVQPIEAAVRLAPDIVATANRFGRILPQPVDAALPKGFEAFRAPPRSKPLEPGAI
jgi:hypothetical protein